MEQELGLTGIGRHYVMPEGETIASLDRKFFDVFVADSSDTTLSKLRVANSYAALLSRLNPDMADLRPAEDDYERTIHFIRGMTAGYNRNDIEFFLYLPKSIRDDIAEKQRTFLESAGITALNWVPSPKTFELIKSQLAAKHGDDWASAKKVMYNGMVPKDADSRLFIQIDFQ